MLDAIKHPAGNYCNDNVTKFIKLHHRLIMHSIHKRISIMAHRLELACCVDSVLGIKFQVHFVFNISRCQYQTGNFWPRTLNRMIQYYILLLQNSQTAGTFYYPWWADICKKDKLPW